MCMKKVYVREVTPSQITIQIRLKFQKAKHILAIRAATDCKSS